MRTVSNTLFIGKELHHLKEVDSTNAYMNYLLSVSKSAPPEGLVVFADNQFAGRGQMGTKWLSEPGQNITMSMLLYPRFLEPKHLFYLNKAVAIAIARAAAKHIPGIRIKWPNDIYAGNKKLAGILIETSLSPSAVMHAITGVGININQPEFDPSLPDATSMKIITGETYDLYPILEDMCSLIEEKYLQLRSYQFKKIDEEYREMLFGLNRELSFSTNKKEFKGIIRGVDENGKIMIEVNGDIATFGVKQVTYLTKD